MPMPTPASTPHVVLFTGHSSYGVLSHLTTDLARAFISTGATAEIVDLARVAVATEFRRIQREGRVAFFCAFSGYGLDLTSGNVLLYDVMNVPYLGLLLDNPCYFPSRHFRASDNLLLLHGDDGHHAVSAEVSPVNSWRGLFRLASSPWTEPAAPLAERAATALFASKGGDPQQYESWLLRAMPAPAARFIFDVAADLGAQHTPQRVWEVARRHAAARGTHTGFATATFYHELVRHADHLARLRRATAVARALQALPVTFVGGEWSHVRTKKSRSTFLPPAPLPAVRRLMAESSVTINVQPGTTDSLHDRLILGLHAGAAVVSDTNDVIDEIVGRDAFHCWDGDPAGIADLVAATLREPHTHQAAADRGQSRAREALTMTRLARHLLDVVQWQRTLRGTTPAVAARALQVA